MRTHTLPTTTTTTTTMHAATTSQSQLQRPMSDASAGNGIHLMSLTDRWRRRQNGHNDEPTCSSSACLDFNERWFNLFDVYWTFVAETKRHSIGYWIDELGRPSACINLWCSLGTNNAQLISSARELAEKRTNWHVVGYAKCIMCDAVIECGLDTSVYIKSLTW